MPRVQLALNVSDIDAAVEFYSKLFGTKPAKRQPGYANFTIAEPALKLVLIEGPSARGAGVGGALNHLGIEVESTGLAGDGTCCPSDEELVAIGAKTSAACC